MLTPIYALLFGLVFGLGLIIAQMTNPNKVLAFLDVAGNWDPSLALVMASALLVLGSALHLYKTPAEDLDAEVTQSCSSQKSGIDKDLILGSSLFGLGWGLSGICPGPAIVDLSSGLPGSYVFVAAVFAGFWLFDLVHKK
jgi:uncharacterized membrane protein YedE/YeeE